MTQTNATTDTTTRPTSVQDDPALRAHIRGLIAGMTDGEKEACRQIERDNYVVANDIMFDARRDLARARALADMVLMTDGQALDEDTLHNTAELLVELLDAVEIRLDPKPAEAATGA